MSVAYKRILLKLSGESLMGDQSFGIDSKVVEKFADEVKTVIDLGVEVGVVIGGGNIYRGLSAVQQGVDRVTGDQMGMLATVINSLAIQNSLEKRGVMTRVMTAIKMDEIAEPLIHRRAVRHLEKKRVVIFAAGTGSPYFTTDTAAVLRAIEIKADVIIKGTRVDGVYSSDPEKNEDAVLYENLSYMEVLSRELKVMDLTAITMCQENSMPIKVFNMNVEENLKNLVLGNSIGTLINADGI